MKNIILFIISVASVAISSTFWKLSSLKMTKALINSGQILSKQLTDPLYILGWCFYLVATILYVYLLGKYEYSKLYPIYVGMCIVLSLVSGFIFFKETSGVLYKMLGISLIICGALVIAKSSN